MTDDEEIAKLRTRLENVVTQIEQLSASNYDLPNTNGPASADLVGKIKALYEERRQLKQDISDMLAKADGPWELATEVDT